MTEHPGETGSIPSRLSIERFRTQLRSAQLTARSNASKVSRRLQSSWSNRPELSLSSDSNAEADVEGLFFQAIDRNFVSRLAVEVAATLGVIDRILAGVTDIGALASACEVNLDALTRLLRLLEARGFVRLTGEEFVQVTPVGLFLADSGPLSWRARLDQGGMGRRMDEAVFHGLLSSIRTGRAAYEHVHGLTFWEDVKERGTRPFLPGSHGGPCLRRRVTTSPFA